MTRTPRVTCAADMRAAPDWAGYGPILLPLGTNPPQEGAFYRAPPAKPPRHTAWSKAEDAAIRAGVEAGDSCGTIARRIGRDNGRIWYRVRHLGLTLARSK